MNFYQFRELRETLKFRVIIIALCVHLSIWLLAVAFSSWTAVNVIFDSLDEELETQAGFVEFSSRQFIQFVGSLDLEFDGELLQKSLSVTETLDWRGNPMMLWNVNRMLIFRTANAPDFNPPAAEGFSDESIVQNGQNTRWRIFYRKIDNISWVAVGADTREVRQAAIQVGLKALYPMVLIVPLTIFGIYWSTARGLKPIAKLAAEVGSRSPTSLEPVDTTGIHDELKPLINALNRLLQQLSGALENEHRFTANAAHELQTPLTAIKSEVQMRQRGVSDPEIAGMLESIGSRVDRAVHTVRQLLTLARLESHDALLEMTRIDLHALVQGVLADHAHTALEHGLDIQFPEDLQWLVRGQGDSLKIMANNLIANAFRYTPEGGKVVIRCEPHLGGTRFCVSNDCDSMTADQRAKLVDRFYRSPGTNSPGAGLGLSIVQRIAAVHGATLSVGSWREEQGLSVIIDFS
ncbi:MAG: ATP-binding protein [Halioglobus sp.]|nr:ATP-binding protein [Halioglobus sp.]